MAVRVTYPMGTYRFADRPKTYRISCANSLVQPKPAPKRYNRTYRGKDTKRILERKIAQIKLIITAFVLVGIFSYFSANYNSKITIEIPKTVVQAEVAQASTATQPQAIEPQTVYASEKDHILAIAKELNFRWPDYLVRLARCENDTFSPKRTNTTGNHPASSVDRGVFMINSYHHAEVPDSCAFDVDCATRWTIKRINDGYQKEWMCDAKIRGL